MAKDSVAIAAAVFRKLTGRQLTDYDIHVNVVGGGNIDGLRRVWHQRQSSVPSGDSGLRISLLQVNCRFEAKSSLSVDCIQDLGARWPV